MKSTATTIAQYNKLQKPRMQEVCSFLELHINKYLKKSESKIWHGTPVWFMDGNPIVSYSARKDERVSLMFFSGQGFGEKDLKPEGSFKAAEIFYRDVKEVKVADLKKWLKKAAEMQWDYKNIVKRKGVLKKIIPQKKSEIVRGFTIKYHAKGDTIWSKGKMKDGKAEGYWEWYRNDGTIKRSGHFKGGKVVGIWTTYDQKGKVYKVTEK